MYQALSAVGWDKMTTPAIQERVLLLEKLIGWAFCWELRGKVCPSFKGSREISHKINKIKENSFYTADKQCDNFEYLLRK